MMTTILAIAAAAVAGQAEGAKAAIIDVRLRC